MYGLYKQAQAGPCDIPEPSDPKGKFKYKKGEEKWWY